MISNSNFTAKSFLKNILQFSISSWVNFILGIVSVIVTTRIFSPDIYGSLTLFNNAVYFLVGVFCLGLDGAAFRFFYEPPEGWESHQLFAECFLIVVIFVLFIGVLGAIFGESISIYLIGINDSWIVLFLMAKVLSLIVLMRFLIQYYRIINDIKKYTIQSVITNLVSRSFVIFAAAIYPSVSTVIQFDSLGVFFLMLFFFYKQRNLFFLQKYNLDFHEFKPIAKFALFSFPQSILAPAHAFLTSYLIFQLLDDVALGIYASTGFIVTAFGIIQEGFRVYWGAFMYRHYREEQAKIVQIHTYVLLGLVVLMGAFIFGQHGIYYFIGEKFHASRVFFLLVLLHPFLRLLNQTTSYGTTLANRKEEELIIFVVTMLLQLGLMYSLLPIFGVLGAAFASAISSLVGFIFSTWRGQVYYRSIESWSMTTVGVCLILLMAVSNCFLADAYLVECVVVLCIFGMAYCVFKKEIRRGIALVKNLGGTKFET